MHPARASSHANYPRASIYRSIRPRKPAQRRTYVIQFLDLEKELQVVSGEGLVVGLPLRLRWHDCRLYIPEVIP